MADMMKRELNGERGLLVAILYQAVDDYKRGRAEDMEDVEQFIESTWYEDILSHLGFPPTLKPEVMIKLNPAAAD